MGRVVAETLEKTGFVAVKPETEADLVKSGVADFSGEEQSTGVEL